MLSLITFVTSITALALYETVLRHPVSYIVGAGHDPPGLAPDYWRRDVPLIRGKGPHGGAGVGLLAVEMLSRAEVVIESPVGYSLAHVYASGVGRAEVDA